jgi:hypothetical protein
MTEDEARGILARAEALLNLEARSWRDADVEKLAEPWESASIPDLMYREAVRTYLRASAPLGDAYAYRVALDRLKALVGE